jgi:Trk K+ transport system NAD-binding subunit
LAERTVHKAVLVVGLGRFGGAVALELEVLGHEVLAMV